MQRRKGEEGDTVWKGRLGRLGHSVVIRFVLNVGCESAIKKGRVSG